MIREAAPAKVNLYLHVVGRRADGYHLLESLVVFADVGDVVEVGPGDGLELSVEGPFAGQVPANADNLVLRAARLLADEVGRTPKLRLRLIKNLPVGAGLGGGSADAAATLRALARLWALDNPMPRLFRIAGALGADVAVCVRSRASLIGGIGEKIETLTSFAPLPAILVHPGRALLTKDVFAARQGPFSPPRKLPEGDKIDLLELVRTSRNDLQAAANSLCPEIGRAIDIVKKNGSFWLSRMTGSGSACFGICEELEIARKVSREMAQGGANWWASAVTLGSAQVWD